MLEIQRCGPSMNRRREILMPPASAPHPHGPCPVVAVPLRHPRCRPAPRPLCPPDVMPLFRPPLRVALRGGPFMLPAMWIVFTGAPSSGKSTLVEALGDDGLPVVGESAREVLTEARGTLDEEEEAVQRLIEARQQAKEAALDRQLRLVLDRALPDSLAYRRLIGMPPDDLLPHIEPARYTMVFLCRFGEHQADGYRKNDLDRARRIEDLLREVYTELGCRLVELPWEPGRDAAAGVAARLQAVRACLTGEP